MTEGIGIGDEECAERAVCLNGLEGGWVLIVLRGADVK